MAKSVTSHQYLYFKNEVYLITYLNQYMCMYASKILEVLLTYTTAAYKMCVDKVEICRYPQQKNNCMSHEIKTPNQVLG